MEEHIKIELAALVKRKRKEAHLTQEEFAQKAGIALTVVRKLEQGKSNLNLSTVNQVLSMIGYTLTPMKISDVQKEPQSDNEKN